eukprot:14291_4
MVYRAADGIYAGQGSLFFGLQWWLSKEHPSHNRKTSWNKLRAEDMTSDCNRWIFWFVNSVDPQLNHPVIPSDRLILESSDLI